MKVIGNLIGIGGGGSEAAQQAGLQEGAQP